MELEAEKKNLTYPEGMLKIYNSSKGRYMKCQNIFENICLLFAERFGKEELSKEIVETLFICLITLVLNLERYMMQL